MFLRAMMNKLLPIPTTNTTTTQKGALSYESTGDACVNLFFKLTRDVSENPDFLHWIDDAWNQDPLATMRILFHGRDCRGGKGDRAPFVKAMAHVYLMYPEWFDVNFRFIPEYGRYLDLIEIMVEVGVCIPSVVTHMAHQLRVDQKEMYDGRSVSLLAKWLPSEGKHWDRELNITKHLCKALFHTNVVTPAHRMALRKEFLVPLRKHIDIVESKMCAGEWEDISFSRVPSVAMHRLKETLRSHDTERFDAWLEAVKEGKSTIQAKMLYPHQIVAPLLDTCCDYDRALGPLVEAQWNVLVEETRKLGALENSLVVCDVSGSMQGQPMHVAIGLGLLISTLADPPFRDALITFHEDPEFFVIPHQATTLRDRVHAIANMKWGGTTNFQKVFDVILQRAIQHNLAPADMPRRLYVLSDMQFDKAFRDANDTTFHFIRYKYALAGYTMPEIVFWNLRSNDTHDFPVSHNERGVALVSGFSPSILKQILSGCDMTPSAIVQTVIDDKRYALIQSPSSKSI